MSDESYIAASGRRFCLKTAVLIIIGIVIILAFSVYVDLSGEGHCNLNIRDHANWMESN